MLLKYFVFALIVFNIANCQYVRVARQSTKGGRQPSPSYIEPQVKEPYVPSPSTGAVQRPRPRPPRPQEEEGSVNIIPSDGEANPEPASYGGVAGTPGVDFPAYTQVPRTNFKCADYPYEPGMYADLDTQCQAYHVCFQGRRESFLCGIGTVFNQAILACDYWYSVDCASSPNFYSVNEELGKANPEPGPGAPVQPRPPAPRPSAPRPSAPSVQPSFPSRPAPRPDYRPPSPSIPRPDYQQPSVEEEVEQPIPKPAPAPQVRPSFPSRPRPVPQPPVKRPQPQPRPPSYQPQPLPQPRPQPPSYQPQPRPQPPSYQPQPRPQPPYQPQPRPQPPSYQPRPQPSRPQPRPQPQPPTGDYRPQPQPQPPRPLPPRPAPRPIPLPPVGKPQPPRPYRPVQPQHPIVQRQEEEPVDDSWLAKEQEPSSQVRESYK